MTRAEMTLKVVMSPSDPLESFVEQYIKLVPDVDINEFQRVLDMKGIRKVDQAPFMDYFRSSAPQASSAVTANPMSSVMKSPTASSGSGMAASALAVVKESTPAAAAAATNVTVSGVGESRIKKLENLIKKRL